MALTYCNMLLLFVAAVPTITGQAASQMTARATQLEVSEHLEIITCYDGSKFLTPKKDYGVSLWLRIFGQYEKPYRDAALAFVPPDAEAVYLDIGANIGVWAVGLARHLGPRGRVIAFEAVLDSYYMLGSTVLLNSLQDNIEVHYGVVGNATAAYNPTSILPIGERLYTNFGSEQVIEGADFTAGVHRRTPTLRLDDMYASGGLGPRCPAFMKLDIELYELNVLRGATKMLQECHPVLFIEMNCDVLNKSIMMLLDRLGYSMAWVVAPFVTHDELTDTFIKQNLYGFFTFEFVYGGANIIAVPKHRAHELVSPLVPIDVDGGKFKRTDINVCHQTFECFYLSELDGESCKTVPAESVDYWRNIPDYFDKQI